MASQIHNITEELANQHNANRTAAAGSIGTQSELPCLLVYTTFIAGIAPSYQYINTGVQCILQNFPSIWGEFAKIADIDYCS